MHYRAKNFLGLTFCCALIITALYFELVKGLAPCPLCILQRLIVISLGILFLVALLHNPKSWGRKVYSVLCLIISAGGMAAASRQIWLQFHPNTDTLCVPSMTYLFKTLPLTEALKLMFIGTGDCSKIQWHFLGLTMPGWTLISFGILFIIALWTNYNSST